MVYVYFLCLNHYLCILKFEFISKMRIISTLFFFLTTLFVFAQEEQRAYLTDEKLVPREHNVDMQHMKLELQLVPTDGKVIGDVTHTFITLQKDVSTIELDGPGIKINKASLDGAEVKFTTTLTKVIITCSPLAWGSKHDLKLSYEATPKKGLYFIGWNDPKNLSRKQIWSQGQGIDNRHWIPFYDEMNDKLTTEMIVTFDSKYKVLSNGTKLSEKDNKNGTKTWHYKMMHPHAPYLVMLGVGEYDIKQSKSKSGVPMNFWYYPEYKDRVEWTYKYSEDMMNYFEKMIGVKYPWESYSQIPVQEFMYGAMENTTATIFGDFYHVDARAYIDRDYVKTNAHELAHQWFGDLVTARSAAHHWLQESFATYYNMMYELRAYGQEHYDWKRRQAVEQALEESKKDLLPIAHSKAGVVRHYPKGAHVLHMLKYVVGEEQYNAAIKYYLEKHAYANVDSEDLLIAFHERLGLSLDWFWEQWVYRGGEPHYTVSYNEGINNEGKKMVNFDVYQVHSTNDVLNLFKMPINFEVHFKDGSKETQQVIIENEHHLVSLENKGGKEIDYVLFDPNSHVMKKVSFEKPFAMLESQAKKAVGMLDRFDAVVAMRNIEASRKRDLFIELYDNEKFHYIKTEILDQLMNDGHPKSIELIRKAMTDKQVEVRMKALDAVDMGLAPLMEDFEKMLNDSSYNVVEKALDKLTMANPSKTNAYLDQTKDQVGATGKNVRIKWLEIAFTSTGNEAHVKELIDYVSQSYEFRTRVNAANALKRLNYFNEELLANIINALESPNKRLANPCGEVLSYFYAQRDNKIIVNNYIKAHSLKPEVRDDFYRFAK